MEIDREGLLHIAERAAERVLMECPTLDTANDYLDAMTVFRQAKTMLVRVFEEHLTRLDVGYNRSLQGRQVDERRSDEGTGEAPRQS